MFLRFKRDMQQRQNQNEEKSKTKFRKSTLRTYQCKSLTWSLARWTNNVPCTVVADDVGGRGRLSDKSWPFFFVMKCKIKWAASEIRDLFQQLEQQLNPAADRSSWNPDFNKRCISLKHSLRFSHLLQFLFNSKTEQCDPVSQILLLQSSLSVSVYS